MTIPELAAALTIAALAAGTTVPAISSALRSWKLTAAARDLSVELGRARMEAVGRSEYVGIRFERSTAGDRWRLYRDGGTRGIRSAEIDAGVDEPLSRPYDLAARHPGIRLGIAGPGALPRIPPSAGTLSASDDPIAFGGSDIFSASPTGETSAGTLYLTDGRDMRAIVVYGPTGRLRIWRFDGDSRQWRQ